MLLQRWGAVTFGEQFSNNLNRRIHHYWRKI